MPPVKLHSAVTVDIMASNTVLSPSSSPVSSLPFNPRSKAARRFHVLLRGFLLAGLSAGLLVTTLRAEPTDDLSQLESEIVRQHNLARQDPALYATYLEALLPLFDDKILREPGRIALRTSEGASAVREAIRFLKKASSAGQFQLSRGMSQAARDHVQDIGASGSVEHQGRDGSQPSDRVNRHGRWGKTVGENMAFGAFREDDARMLVMQLLIDDGVSSRGHRSNIFNAQFQTIGVSCGPHASYDETCVIDYAGSYQENSQPPASPALEASPRPKTR